jgi:hypothetical protein
MRELNKIITLKPEPETTPSLPDLIQAVKAKQTVSEYRFTATLRAHFKRIFDTAVNRQGQGFWVQAEYGAGKTHFLGALVDLLVWRDQGVWDCVTDAEIKTDYAGALSKLKLFPVAFSLRGMGQSGDGDSLMRIFEEQIRQSLDEVDAALSKQIRITSAELADNWYAKEATDAEKAGVDFFFQKEHKTTPQDFRAKSGAKKFGEELVRSKLPEGRLRGKFKERFSYIYEQVTKLGGYDGMIFVVDEFRSWQDRHPEGTPAYAEDEEVLETLAFVLPTLHLNIITIIASQGDMPQKLSGGGQGDRFVPLYLLADKNKGDFGEIVTFRVRELKQGAATDIKDYYDHCRKEYKFIKQGNISLEYFSAIFPFQPRCFEVMRRLTQNAEKHNLPTARSAIRMAWQSLADGELVKGDRLLVLPDIFRTDELRKGLNHEHYRDAYQNLQGAIEQLPDLDVGPEEREQCERVLQTLLLWGLSLPENLRDGLTAQEVAEATWLHDDDVGANEQAASLLEKLIQNGYPVRTEKKPRNGEEVAVYSYETSVVQANPTKYFSPLKKRFNQDTKRQDEKWLESLFWGLKDITPDAQTVVGVNGGLFATFTPPDTRSARDVSEGKPPQYQFPHRSGAKTRKVHKVEYSGQVVVSDRWRNEFGEEIKNADEHFRIVYLTSKPSETDAAIGAALQETCVAVCRPDALSTTTRDALADLLAAEEMKKQCAAPNQGTLREYADGKRRDAVKAILKAQLDEFRRGKVLNKAGYAIQSLEVFSTAKDREDALAGKLLEKAYDIPLFSPKELKKEFTDTDARKLFAGLFTKEAATAEREAVINFGAGLELAVKSHPGDFRPEHSQAIGKIKQQLTGNADKTLADLKSAFCRPPYALTEAMVCLYAFSMVKSGGYELVLNQNTAISLNNGKPLPGNKLTPHTIGLCKWSATLDKALLGARLAASVQKGWNDVLPWARVLDDTLKPATTPDDELERDKQLMGVLGSLKVAIDDVERQLPALAEKLDGVVPPALKETFQRLRNLAEATSYAQFDVVVRENYGTPADFETAHEQFQNARKLSDQAFVLTQARDYLDDSCELGATLNVERVTHLGFLKFEALLKEPQLVAVRLEGFGKWKERYGQAYRKAHRAHYESLQSVAAATESLRPGAMALSRINTITELGPPLAGTLGVLTDLQRLDGLLWICPDAVEADVAGTHSTCPKCRWTPGKTVPQQDHDQLSAAVSQGLGDRFQRLKDASISAVLKKAASENQHEGLKALVEIIQLADAGKLVDVMTDELVAFLRQLLHDENLVQEKISLTPILQQVGAIEEDRVDEAVSKITRLLTKALKDAKANHGPGKRVRCFLTTDENVSPGKDV